MITLETLRQHCRVDDHSEDEMLEGYLNAAREMLVRHTGRNWYEAGQKPAEDETGLEYTAAAEQAMLLLVGHWYVNREAVAESSHLNQVELPLGFWALVQPYRVYGV